jgi:uncharacterized protein (TIGR03084 family)
MPTADDRLAEVLADLNAEGDRVAELVAPLDDAGWRTPTPAEGWDVAHQVGHLTWTDEVALLAATDQDGWDRVVHAAVADPGRFVDDAAAEVAATDHVTLLERWLHGRKALAAALDAHPPGQKIPWFGPPMSATSMATARFMETWAHGLDVAEALGAVDEPTDRIRHVVHLGVRTRDFAFATRGLDVPAAPFRVELEAPSGAVWTYGPQDAAQSVRGPAYHFCLLVTQRRHRADLDLAVIGPEADRWLDIAQAFAGPPGSGRTPRGDA